MEALADVIVAFSMERTGTGGQTWTQHSPATLLRCVGVSRHGNRWGQRAQVVALLPCPVAGAGEPKHSPALNHNTHKDRPFSAVLLKPEGTLSCCLFKASACDPSPTTSRLPGPGGQEGWHSKVPQNYNSQKDSSWQLLPHLPATGITKRADWDATQYSCEEGLFT